VNVLLNRRAMLLGGSLLLAATVAPDVLAQDKPVLRFSAVFSEQDIRAEMTKKFAADIKNDFTLEPYFGGTLFKQGTELVALQRGNLEMGNIAAQDISNQIPAWSIVTSAYLFRDAAHMRAVFASDIGGELKKMAEDQLGIHILGPTYYGARQIGLVPKTNPTPMAYAEVYTGLQSGAIDGQDNPLPNVQNMKFYEVMSQIALTSHLVGFDLFTVSSKVWNDMTPERLAAFQAAADKAIEWSTQEHLKREGELVAFFKEKGLDVYTPDVAAFRSYAQQKYLESDLAKNWPKGMLDKINAM
jgi:TRAP-type C4-dicarboxylate transport system substrate-binding protein